ncbi:hypothetical protein BGX28_003003 [Mortierella sp. GBA30]|nr:hypothetical protein BGX28_003003 [Mortierella sp. GBA30]
MKIPTLLSCSALFLATVVSSQATTPATGNVTAGRIEKCINPGVVALTFDDGPGKFNDQLLALLKKKNVVATFFVLGQMIAEDPQQAASLKKMLDSGHQLASHTYSHGNLDSMTEDKMKQEMSSTSDIMFKNSGVRPRYMRAPEGACAEKCLQVMAGLGLIVSHWNVDTNDWRHTAEAAIDPIKAANLSMADISDKIVAKSNPKADSFIILEHEIHQFSVEHVAEQVIDAVLQKGYKFVSMEDCVGKPAYLEGSIFPSKSAGANPTGSTATAGKATDSTPTRGPSSAAGATKVATWALGMSAVFAYLLL